MSDRRHRFIRAASSVAVVVLCAVFLRAEDFSDVQDPEGLPRLDGSRVVAYHGPQFDEFVLPLGRMTNYLPTRFEKSKTVEGMISRYTYAAPDDASPFQMMKAYKRQFERQGVASLYEAGPGMSTFSATLGPIGEEDGLHNVFDGSSLAQKDRLLIGKSSTEPVTYYFIYAGTKDRSSLTDRIGDEATFAEVIVIATKSTEAAMVPTAEEMKKALRQTGKVDLYGVYFDSDRDALRPDAASTLKEIAQVLQDQPSMNLRVVGHTDNQGSSTHNLDLSKRRAEAIVRELTSHYGIAPERLDAFGCGLYAPIASNATDDGRAKNRRVELLAFDRQN